MYFSRVKGHTGTAVLRNKGPVQPQSPDEPNRYDPQLKQDATQYSYDFDVRGSPYRVTIVVFRENDTWKINEVEGGYLRNE